MDSYRKFQAGPDPFGRTWHAEFQWLQTAISIRHSDSVDVKFVIWTEGGAGNDAEPKQERVIALMHPDLLAVTAEVGHALTDPFCGKLAAMHLVKMIETFEDMDKTLVTVSKGEMLAYAQSLTQAPSVIYT
jgi:hypothetical protein